MKPKTYNITPAKGQALLNFQGRLLPSQNLEMQLFETDIIEQIKSKGKPKEEKLNADFTNLLLHGDCLSACAYLKSKDIKVDLVYIDPPFASGANYAKRVHLRNGKETEFENDDTSIGEEVMYGDIWQKEDYLNWLYERLLAIREIMSEKASIYLHLDWHIGQYGKILMDEVFGEENFRNEIIWTYGGKGLVNTNSSFVPYNANIYFYTKSNDYYLNNKSDEVSQSVIQRFGKLADKDGNIYFGTLIEKNEKTEYEKARKRFVKEFGKEPTKKDLAWNIKNGSLLKNIWDDIPIIRENAVYGEYRNYSTQKPEDLLKRIINASSDAGMIVADFFIGSGTTALVANDLDRKFVASDIGINAVQTSRDDLVKRGAGFDVIKVKDGVRLFRNPTQTTQKLFSLINGFKPRAELGLGEFWDGGIVAEKGSFEPVKFIGIDKKLTKELLDAVLEEIYALEEAESGASKVNIIYAFKDLEIDQSYVNKEIKDAGKTTLAVELISLDDLLAEKRDMLFSEDSADIEIKKEGSKCKVKIKKFFSPYLKAKIDEYNARKVKKGTLEENKQKSVKISDEGLELIEAVQFDTDLKKSGIWTSDLDLEDKAGVKDKIKGVYELPSDKFKMKIRNIAGDEIILDFSK